MCFLWHYGFYSPTVCFLGDTTGKVAFASPYTAPQQIADVFLLHGRPVLNVKAGVFHLRAFSVVIGKRPLPHGGVSKATSNHYIISLFTTLLTDETKHTAPASNGHTAEYSSAAWTGFLTASVNLEEGRIAVVLSLVFQIFRRGKSVLSDEVG